MMPHLAVIYFQVIPSRNDHAVELNAYAVELNEYAVEPNEYE